jgi:hypothetical protein
MVRFWWLAVPLLTIAHAHSAHAGWAEAVTALSNLCDHLIAAYSADKTQQKKDALALVDSTLTHMSSLKKHMAVNLRCMAKESPDDFARCYNNLRTANDELASRVRRLHNSIQLIDPNWVQNHRDETRQIDDLYYEKVGLQQRTLEFARSSEHGIFHRISVVPDECEKLANELDKEAERLDMTQELVGKALKDH